MKFAYALIVNFLSLVLVSETAKILGLFTTFSKSHLIIHKAVCQTLIDRGHDVTIVTTLPLEDSNKNYRHILLDVPPPPKEFLAGIIKSGRNPFGIFHTMMQAMEFNLKYNNVSLYDPQMKRLMAEESFDLVIFGYFSNSFQLGVAAHFKCPVVITFMQRPMGFINSFVGNPMELTSVPHMLTGSKQPMSFFDRIRNVFGAFVMDGFFSYIEHKSKQFYEYNFPVGEYPSYQETLKNVSLLLTCYHFSNGIIRPNVPAVIEIGGIQVKPTPDPLPNNIKNFLDNATEEGAIYFSLGSNARSADMSPDTIEIVYRVLSNLKQSVIWKWEDDTPPGNASNIMFNRWLPQDDILAHPNIKLFVTHGGHGSVVESEYHGVPMVGMPLFGDQFSNMDAVQQAGHGLSMGKEELTEKKFSRAVLEVLENPEHREKVQRFSRLYKDRPMNARDTAAYWLEYVIRHKGAKHMQSPAVHMNFIQYYGLDVFAFLSAVVYVVCKFLVFVFKKCIYLFCGGKCKNESQERRKGKKDQ